MYVHISNSWRIGMCSLQRPFSELRLCNLGFAYFLDETPPSARIAARVQEMPSLLPFPSSWFTPQFNNIIQKEVLPHLLQVLKHYSGSGFVLPVLCPHHFLYMEFCHLSSSC